MNLCMGCMSEKQPDQTCRICGYTDNSPFLPSYLPPKTLLNERYIVGKLTSYNGESAVYLGYDTVTDTKVDIREYMPDILCSRDKTSTAINIDSINYPLYKAYLSEFIDLNKALIKIRSMSHLQSAIEIFAENNTGYVIFEHIDGIPLRTYLSNCAGELTWEQVNEIFPPLFTTLGLVHSAGIIHRGLSPSTILLTDKGEVKLTGFNIAACRTTNSELACEVFAGYSAPEQYTTNNWHGTWTDVYGICAVLYRVLTGTCPVEAVIRSGHDSLIEPAMLNRSIPSNVSKVIMAGMTLSTATRIQTITELVDKLFEVPSHNENKTVQVSTRSSVSSGKRGKKRKQNKNMPFIIGGVSVVLLFGFTLAIILPLIISGDEPEDSDIISNFYTRTTTGAVTTSSHTSSVVPVSSQPVINEPTYIVPSFVGKHYEVVTESVKNLEMFTFKTIFDFNSEYSNGYIYEQDIEVDSQVKKGTEITIKISKGPEIVKLPDYEGKLIDDYLAELDKLQVKYEKAEFKTNDVAENMVYMTSKQVGDDINVAQGEEIKVYYAVNFEEEVVVTESESVQESDVLE